MHLVNNRLLPRHTYPARVVPRPAGRINHATIAMEIDLLPARRRIRHAGAIVKAVAIACAGRARNAQFMHTVMAAHHGLSVALRDFKPHPLLARYPDAEPDVASWQHPRTKLIGGPH